VVARAVQQRTATQINQVCEAKQRKKDGIQGYSTKMVNLNTESNQAEK